MSQIQELRTSVCEKTETIDTLKQELKDISVSSVTDKIHLSTSQIPQEFDKCYTRTKGLLWSNRFGNPSQSLNRFLDSQNLQSF